MLLLEASTGSLVVQVQVAGGCCLGRLKIASALLPAALHSSCGDSLAPDRLVDPDLMLVSAGLSEAPHLVRRKELRSSLTCGVLDEEIVRDYCVLNVHLVVIRDFLRERTSAFCSLRFVASFLLVPACRPANLDFFVVD